MNNASAPSFGGTISSARGALEKCIQRDSLRREIAQGKLEMAVRLMREAMLCLSGDLMSTRVPVHEPEESETLNHRAVVKAGARTFGEQHFSVDELCALVADTFPGLFLDRQTVSRRLFDLRSGSNPVIKLVSVNLPSGHPVRKGRRYLYSYVGPPC